jgi:hypothetical protein
VQLRLLPGPPSNKINSLADDLATLATIIGDRSQVAGLVVIALARALRRNACSPVVRLFDYVPMSPPHIENPHFAPPIFYGKAATTMTSTSIPGCQKSVVRQARAGGFAGSTHSFQIEL